MYIVPEREIGRLVTAASSLRRVSPETRAIIDTRRT
jgi:hypothetical protein